MSYVWVIEIKFIGDSKWQSCADCAINRKDGRELLAEWRQRNRIDAVRLRKYVRAEEKKP